jgi:enoyl-CoA hydratase/carnithine racemase
MAKLKVTKLSGKQVAVIEMNFNNANVLNESVAEEFCSFLDATLSDPELKNCSFVLKGNEKCFSAGLLLLL